MSCETIQPDVALYAGGDLPAARLTQVEQHINGCPDCQVLLDDLSALLAGLRYDPVQDATVAQVRRRVYAGMAGPPASDRYWKWAFAAAALLALLSLWPRRPASLHVTALHPLIHTAIPVWTVVNSQPLPKRVRRGVPKPVPPLLVQFVTSDPNIVIYWLVDPKPQGD